MGKRFLISLIILYHAITQSAKRILKERWDNITRCKMKDKIAHDGRISCFCSKCHSKNVYYLKQRKVVLPFSPNNKMIRNQDNGGWHTLRTIREHYCMYDIAWSNAETELLMLVCRDCGESEQVEL